jgi:hypothetical protein
MPEFQEAENKTPNEAWLTKAFVGLITLIPLEMLA